MKYRIAAAVFILIVLCLAVLEYKRISPRQLVEHDVEKTSKMLPVKMDEVTDFVKIEIVNDDIIYYYEVKRDVVMEVSDERTSMFAKLVSEDYRKRNGPMIDLTMKAKMHIKMRYLQNGKLMFMFDVL